MKTRTMAVYLLKNSENGKKYIGSTSHLEHRISSHISEINTHTHGNPHINDDSYLFDLSSFSFSVLEKVSSKELLIEREQYWIEKLKPEYNYNKIAGSSLDGYMKTPLARIKHSITMTGRKQSPETIAKRVETMKRNGKQKLKVVTPEQRKYLSEINTGEKNPNWGLKRSEETRKKQSVARAKVEFTFKCPNDSIATFTNLRLFSKGVGIKEWVMRDLCSGKIKKYNGWEFISKRNL